jgi:exopolysaccharide biosynthesis polyprenyl glycosylphosphotransferase
MDNSAIYHMEFRAEDFPVANAVSRRNRNAPTRALARSGILKRATDLAFSILGSLILLPLLIIVGLAVKLDTPGPVLFSQTRRGLRGRPFRILKFRTMTVLEDGRLIEQAKREDSRVTRVGWWLRRTSIDELPQLINVIKGDMSLVGPRPHAVAHDDYYSGLIAEYRERQDVKPGITGWAQINGARGETPELDDMRRRVELDLWYVHRWTVGLDFKIIMITATQILRSPNAF